MKREVKSSYERKHIVLIILGVIAFIAVVSVLLASIFHQYYVTIIDNQKEQMLTIAKSVSKTLEIEVESFENDLGYLIESEEFVKRRSLAQETGQFEELKSLLVHYYRSHAPEVADIMVCNGNPNDRILSISGRGYEKIHDVSTLEDNRVELWKTGENSILMSVSKEDQYGSSLYMFIDLKVLYNNIVSYIKLGDKGYVMVKDAQGTVIMHRIEEQIGIDVIEDRKLMYPDLDFEGISLENMIANQKEGKEDVEIYTSYWWADEEPSLIRKMSAYTPANIGNGFLIVSAVIDFAEISNPITVDMVKIVFLSILIFGSIAFLGAEIANSVKANAKMERENAYLRELNQTLETLHQNEIIMSHQQRLQIIGTMTGGIAHEFNNLLTPIMGYSGLMLENMDKDDIFYEDISEIYDASEKAKEIINQISSLSKRNMDTVFKYCNVNQVLTRALKMAKSIKPVNVELRGDFQPGSQGFFGNATQLNQVILNLCVNAFHAMDTNQGEITIGYRQLCTEDLDGMEIPLDIKGKLEAAPEEFGIIEVRDNGCGMDEETMSRIFDPFFTTKATTGGTGLGLSIVQNIVDSHNGAITVSSRKGEGTAFTIILPIIQEEPQKSGSERKRNSGIAEDMKILLVDDNPKVLKLLEKGLKMAGFEVDCRINPLEAAEELKLNSYNLLVSDDHMKEISGLELAKKAKQTSPEIKIIILTGMLRREIIEARQVGLIDDYMIKPTSISSLIEKMNMIKEKS